MPRQQQTRELLVEHAVGLLEEVGLARFTAREVARRVGVSHAAPFRHFPGRVALLAGVASSGYRDLRSRLSAAESPAPCTWHDKVVDRAMEYVAFAEERPAIFELMFRSELVSDARDVVQDHCRTVFALLLDGVAGDADRSATSQEMSMLAGVHGLAVLAGQGLLGPVPREHLRRTLAGQISLAHPSHGKARSF